MGKLITDWLWIIAIAVVILLVVHPNSKAKSVVGALSGEVTNNVKALQGNAPGKGSY